MAANLNFSVVANNTVTLQLSILDADGEPVDGTGLTAMKWQWFLPGQTITKSIVAGSITVVTYNPLVVDIALVATDTLGAIEGTYAHEAVATDANGYPVTITNNDTRLTWGMGFVRRELVVQ